MSTKNNATTLALLGGGVMGSAVLESVVRDGLDPASVRLTTLDPQQKERWEERGVTVTDNASAVTGADTVLVATKPPAVAAVLDEAAPALDPSTLVICLAAGVRIATLEEHLPERTPVVRVMPNTPALIGQGMSVLSGGTHCTDDHLERARALLATCGEVAVVPEEQQDAVTAVSGSGPAYLFTVAEALVEGGVLVGLPRPTAKLLAEQTLLGAAAMLRESETSASGLREQVTSPGGTTAAGLRELERAGLRAAFLEAVQAAHDRSLELGA